MARTGREDVTRDVYQGAERSIERQIESEKNEALIKQINMHFPSIIITNTVWCFI